MRVADLSKDRVAERLGALEEAYSSFPVNQTTLSVSGDAYERARERCTTGLADVYVQVYDDAGEVLLVESDDGLTVPHAEPGTDEDEPPTPRDFETMLRTAGCSRVESFPL